MTARRTLSPAARGVVLAVRAALRAGRVDLADQADGSTLATSTAPDGTVLLRAVLRLPVPGAADPRQLTLPAVAPVPQPAEVPPAPVAVPAGDGAAPRSLWISMDEWHGTAASDDREWLHEPIEGVLIDWAASAPPLWMTADALDNAAALAALRRYCNHIGITLHESDTMPPPPARGLVFKDPERRAFALASGDLIELDGARVRVAHVDGEGFTWAEVNRNGFSVGEVERCLWREVEHLGETRWRVLPVETETPAAKAKPKRAKPAPAPLPAEATDAPLPEGDELVDVVLRECPTTMRGLDVVADGTGRIVLWAFASKTSDELVATVPADLARMIQAKARAWWGSWCAATRPASVVTVGGDAPTLHGPRKVLGVAPYDDSCDGIVLATPKGPQVAWLDNVSLERGVATVHPSPAWEVTQGADGTWLAERLPDKTKKPKRAAKVTKTAPARNVPVPQADAIAQSYRGAIVIVWQVAEGAAWERVWSEPSPKAAAIESAWQAACEAHRARQYNRGGKCTRDSRDGAS